MYVRNYVLIILLFLSLFSIAYAEGDVNEDVIHIVTYEEDLTGDGDNELIKVEGVYLSDNSSYYHTVWATITSSTNEVWKIDLPGGFIPTMQFADLTNDGTLDLLYQNSTDRTKDTITHALYTRKDNNFIPIALPEETFIHGRLQDNFLAHLFITPHHRPVIIDLKEHAHTYIHSGIYDEYGNLLQQQNVRIGSINEIQPLYNEHEHQHSLYTTQQIHALPYREQLGIIESEWIYEDEAWRLIQSRWK